MTNTEPAIQINNVSQQFGSVTALDQISLDIQPQEVHCLLGASGSGKSTLLRVIAGLQVPTAGNIVIGTQMQTSSSVHVAPEKRSIGFVFQDYALFPHLSALRNVLFAMPNQHSSARRQEATSLLAQVGLSDRVDFMPHMLSGGEQQRVALARALARQPRIMLLDEPFSGLDTHLRKTIRDLTFDILRKKGITVILVTHDPEEALTSANRISLMKAGKVIQTGNAMDVYLYPRDEPCAKLFGKINRIAATPATEGMTTEFGLWPQPHASQNAQVAMIRPENLIAMPTDEPSAIHQLDSVVHEGRTHLYRIRNTHTGQELFSRSLGFITDLKPGDRVALALRPPANHTSDP
ncbi:MAG: ABC transporter ATP-binding protein [Mariniblastus sp.]|nr:ABC transporter ATP-binding protein [Mariniblastus sp.]